MPKIVYNLVEELKLLDGMKEIHTLEMESVVRLGNCKCPLSLEEICIIIF